LRGPLGLAGGLALFGSSTVVRNGREREAAYVTALVGDCDADGRLDACAIARGFVDDLDDDLQPDDCQSCLAWIHCRAGRNAAGSEARMGWSGSLSVSAADFALEVSGALPLQHGLFFYGADQRETPFGEGFLCVAGRIFRLAIVRLDGEGRASHSMDFRHPPHPDGTIRPGTGWSFQFAYRDLGGARFNTSDALRARFCF
jgi:hypothetical protein